LNRLTRLAFGIEYMRSFYTSGMEPYMA